jgi:hypothetical protein
MCFPVFNFAYHKLLTLDEIYHPLQHDYWINYDEEDIDPFASSLER